MLRIGVTGGIGSGKTIVCKIFESLGIPVYNADVRAKELMQFDVSLVSSLKIEFGEKIYLSDGQLNRDLLSQKVFNNLSALIRLNSLVHPVVMRDSENWMEKQIASPYAIKEAALLFESGSSENLDYIISVFAPEKIRTQRIKKRDQLSEEQILARMNNQMSEEEKKRRADFVITNDESQLVIPQVIELHEQLKRLT